MSLESNSIQEKLIVCKSGGHFVGVSHGSEKNSLSQLTAVGYHYSHPSLTFKSDITLGPSLGLVSGGLVWGYAKAVHLGITCRFHSSMMTSSNGNIFGVTGPLCGEFTVDRWIPHTKDSDAELWSFLWSAPEQTVVKTIKTLVIWYAIALIMTSL